jgi:mono/diheme cytochrome c family protein
MTIQPRHIKLHLAGEQRNWSYAAYELGELRNAFARIARTIPLYHAIDTANITTAVTQAPLDAIDEAIKAHNPSQFTAAYARLTQACNACHQSLNHGAVAIRVPTGTMFADQDFGTPNSR